jgi:hypothetical protein
MVNETRKSGWSPKFSAKVGDKSVDFFLPEYAIRDCPVSFITGESQTLVELHAHAEIAKDNGGTMFGPDASKWPAWWADAQGVIAMIKRSHEKAFEKAVSK